MTTTTELLSRIQGLSGNGHTLEKDSPLKIVPSEKATRIRPASDCLAEARNLPAIKPLFGTYWQSGEIAILAADPGTGKSVLAVQVAETIAGGLSTCLEQPCAAYELVLYYDFELSDRQFGARFENRHFPRNLLRVDFDPTAINPAFGIEQIFADVEKTGAGIIIIDNLTALALKSTADADAAISVMRGLKRLQVEKNVSSLVLGHTPKLPSGIPLNLNHLAGSKTLSNFADSVFFLGRSREGKHTRYLKQVKARNAELPDGELIIELVKRLDGLRFEFHGYGNESDHLPYEQLAAATERKSRIDEKMQKVWQLSNEGYTIRGIHAETGFSVGSITNYLKKKPTAQCSIEDEQNESSAK